MYELKKAYDAFSINAFIKENNTALLWIVGIVLVLLVLGTLITTRKILKYKRQRSILESSRKLQVQLLQVPQESEEKTSSD
jgi:cytochrome c-type biogenesis protein CcmH/NrfF